MILSKFNSEYPKSNFLRVAQKTSKALQQNPCSSIYLNTYVALSEIRRFGIHPSPQYCFMVPNFSYFLYL